MTIFIVTLLVLISLAVLLYPLLSPGTQPFDAEDPSHELTQRLRRARDRVYEEIRILQQEYFLSYLSKQEYQDQINAARQRAAQLLRQQDQVQQTVAQLGQQVEEDLQRALSRGPPPSAPPRPEP